MNPQTLLDKIWQSHTVTTLDDGNTLLYIDHHFLHEVTSPQAFEGLRLNDRKVRRPERSFATMDHNVPTTLPIEIKDAIAQAQISTLEKNCHEFGVTLFGMDSEHQGIVHVIGPELGLTQPGMTIVCGDSHTATHGAFGALAFGIGTSEVEHVLATQCLISKKPKSFLVKFTGQTPPHITAKDLILYLIGQIGTAGGTGHVFEFVGEPIEALSMESRLTLCNMSIEAGARAGLIAPDEVTFDYFRNVNRKYAPKDLDNAINKWKELKSDQDATYDRTIEIDVTKITPQVTWGTSPGMVCGIDETVPNVDAVKHVNAQDVDKALTYMGLTPGQKIEGLKIDVVFIGSCTNGRIEDLRAAANVLKGNNVHADVMALVVPGSKAVQRQAIAEGLDKIFIESGAQWREPGCSMCLAMNPDKLKPGQRAASTSNRNFEGRQGKDGRTHLVSPIMAATAAIHGCFVNVVNTSEHLSRV